MGFVATPNGGWECLICGRCFAGDPPDHHHCVPKQNPDKGRIAELTAELAESALLHGKGMEREAALIARAEKAEAERDAMRELLTRLLELPGAIVSDANIEMHKAIRVEARAALAEQPEQGGE